MAGLLLPAAVAKKQPRYFFHLLDLAIGLEAPVLV
jgi:hypothetical protein